MSDQSRQQSLTNDPRPPKWGEINAWRFPAADIVNDQSSGTGETADQQKAAFGWSAIGRDWASRMNWQMIKWRHGAEEIIQDQAVGGETPSATDDSEAARIGWQLRTWQRGAEEIVNDQAASGEASRIGWHSLRWRRGAEDIVEDQASSDKY
ncbi:hypothetical protein GYMLUDRAFT_60505 [Collybiopsis luxurians FD-317 M1]|uniref:Unplaced genomic scaffold GYMLUscaffold_35, whole genome shotgun sequence n=1 Tax=Collybiopsis luxurians FD-317 M1 TaxID=944289 RepID=A0A0D0B5T2_9AGAR|nr:hypothetical protein GYMLUDRAFT_60505 [Collybiopsis luxurians FD-317 M1]